MNYERVLQKCVASVYPGTAADCNSDFYVANGRGLPICCGDNIAIDNDQAEEELIPWSLGMYIHQIIECPICFKSLFLLRQEGFRY